METPTQYLHGPLSEFNPVTGDTRAPRIRVSAYMHICMGTSVYSINVIHCVKGTDPRRAALFM